MCIIFGTTIAPNALIKKTTLTPTKCPWVKCDNYSSIHEAVQLIVMHATHTVTFLVKLRCRGNAVQREEERDRARAE